jgi:hypothetical protein
VIDASQGDTILIELRARRELKNTFATGLILTDSVLDALSSAQIFTNGDRTTLTYIVGPESGEWLYIYCNDELALRYKLNVKKGIAVTRTP